MPIEPVAPVSAIPPSPTKKSKVESEVMKSVSIAKEILKVAKLSQNAILPTRGNAFFNNSNIQ